MDYQHSNRMRPPPPPSMADPHHQLPQRQPVPPLAPWYSSQFQYQPQSQHSPSPPPPPLPQPGSQWAQPSHSDHPPPYPPPIPHSHYPPPPLSNQYPPLPPRPQVPPPPPPLPYSQVPQPYSQDWGNPNLGHYQGWEYPAHNNEEDWAAKARAWAAAKAATDNQQLQSPVVPVNRVEEKSYYHDQYPQNIDAHYMDVQQLPSSAFTLQQYPTSAAPPLRTSISLGQDSSSISSGNPSYFPDGHLHYNASDGSMAKESNAGFLHQDSSATSSTVHLQEVPSSYSSIADKEETGDQQQKLYNSSTLPITSTLQQHVQPTLSDMGRSMEQAPYAFNNQKVEHLSDLSDQPLDFAPRFSRDNDPHVQSNYINHPGGAIRGIEAMPPIHAWNSVAAPGISYPPIPPVLPPGTQVDPSIAVASPLSGHSAAIFGRMAGSSLQSTIPPVGAAFGVNAGSSLHSTPAFPGDAYTMSAIPERPKKASVPNWLREEIIKKAVIVSSAPELTKEETQSTEDEGVDKSLMKGDLADNKSIDSSRSTEEEDDDEDYAEAARSAAINQEIKRVLTEVLLKVTDELFDEIATKVLGENVLTIEAETELYTDAPDSTVVPATAAIITPKATAKVLIPTKAKKIDFDDSNRKFSPSSPGDLLGLGNYASDDEDDNELNKENTMTQQPTVEKLSEDVRVVENGSLQAERREYSIENSNVDNYPNRINPNGLIVTNSDSDNWASRDNVRSSYFSKAEPEVVEDGTNIDDDKGHDSNASKSKTSVGVKSVMKIEPAIEKSNVEKSVRYHSQGGESRNEKDKNDRHDIKSPGKRIVEVGSRKKKTHDKGDEDHESPDEKHARKGRTDDRNGSRERTKEQVANSGEKAKDSVSRRRSSHSDAKLDRKETERDRRATPKEDNDLKRGRTKDRKGEKLKSKYGSDTSRHKRSRSSSVGSRGRNSKDSSSRSRANNLSDESSDDSKRKLHWKRHESSPSPVRSRRRQDSPSSHSKHSLHRHSPYSSLEMGRGRRSRSRSPIRRPR